MVRISIMYPNIKGAKFDVDYYVKTHMPMSINFMKGHPGYKGVSVERGSVGVAPNSEPAFIAMTHYLFRSIEDFWDACTPHSETLQNDLSKCTAIASVIQINEVLISG